MDDPFDKIEKVKKVTSAGKAIDIPEVIQEVARQAPNKEHFDDLLKQTQQRPEKIALEDTPKQNSLMDEVRAQGTRTDKPTVVTPTELVAQTEQAVNKLEGLKMALQEPGAQLRPSTVPLLQNKLIHIDENIKVALNKAGVEHKIQTAAAVPSNNPIMRFLGFLTDGQYQLNTLSTEVEKWHLNKVEITPATMLSLQIKVGYITQELEFFSSLLNKALESTKTIMNVQV
jgi:hypothetical protein